jgi:hypothetical protein
MENKRGFHVTIVDNNTGETIRDFDTRAINFVALHESEKGKEIMREWNPLAGTGMVSTGMVSTRLADQINIMEAYSLVNGLQGMIKDEFEAHPVFELMAGILESETFTFDGDE